MQVLLLPGVLFGPFHLSWRTRRLIQDVRHCEDLNSSENHNVNTLFFGMFNVLRRFVPHLARVSSPLNSKLMKSELARFYHMTDIKIVAIETLKALILSPLSQPYFVQWTVTP